MLPRQGEMGENTPFTRKCTSEPSETLERVTTQYNLKKNKLKQRKIHQKSYRGLWIFCYSLFHVSIQQIQSIVVGGDGGEAPFNVISCL